ncbi:MAG: hypothetical protein ACOVPA_07785 [Rubrivivax sp.]|jgi:hypothetical protein
MSDTDDAGTHWRDGCEDCLRRTSPPANPHWQPWISPPAILVFFCPHYIEP